MWLLSWTIELWQLSSGNLPHARNLHSFGTTVPSFEVRVGVKSGQGRQQKICTSAEQ